MPRPKRIREVSEEPEYVSFLPDGIAQRDEVMLCVEELEAVRLVDLWGKTHGEAAVEMGVSRTTVTEIYESARHKIADSLVNGKQLTITGGHYQLKNSCAKNWEAGRPCLRKGQKEMRIAVPFENGQIFQHFGRTQSFKLYDVEDGKVNASQVVETGGAGHGALVGFLQENRVDAVICGGIGGGAYAALEDAGIRLYGGVSGSADEAVQAHLAGTLAFDPAVRCSHHGHEHGGGHSCRGEGHQGCHEGHCHKDA